MRTRVILLTSLIPLLEATSCVQTAYFYVANLSPLPVHLTVSAPCEPCPTPQVIAVKDLRPARNPNYYLERQSPARADVGGRIDSLIAYSLVLPPDQAVMLFGKTFGGTATGSGGVASRLFAGVRISAITSADTVTYDGFNVADALRRWHKLIYVIELK